MQDARGYFKDKKITVLGLGLLGRGVGDTAFLAECGAELIVTDLKSEEELTPSIEKLSSFSNITYTLGTHREEDFKGRDMILVAAGVPQDSPYIAIARDDGAHIAMSGALFALLSGIPIIGITGTRGKSTVTHMIHHVLTQATEGAPVLLGGNVRGVSNLELLRDVTEDALAVMELDSWQLQGFREEKISPQIAVFTSFMEDHLNYYKGDMDMYFADKANIFLYQEAGDTLITTHEVWKRIEQTLKGNPTQEVVLVDETTLPEDCLLTMPGEHNRLNAALAYEALRAVGLGEEEIYEHLATFPGVPGRLEYLGTVRGMKVYNDNNATTPQATIAGIMAVGEGKNVILIAGGSYKEVDPTPLVPVIQKHCKQVILIPGTGTDILAAKLATATQKKTLEEAVTEALLHAQEGDVLLFSPGFASFGMFKNEYERNDQFVQIIQSYETE